MEGRDDEGHDTTDPQRDGSHRVDGKDHKDQQSQLRRRRRECVRHLVYVHTYTCVCTYIRMFINSLHTDV